MRRTLPLANQPSPGLQIRWGRGRGEPTLLAKCVEFALVYLPKSPERALLQSMGECSPKQVGAEIARRRGADDPLPLLTKFGRREGREPNHFVIQSIVAHRSYAGALAMR